MIFHKIFYHRHLPVRCFPRRDMPSMETIKEAWSGILDYLHRQDDISEVAYNVWLSCIEPRSIEDGEVVVYVHTQFQKKIIQEHYAGKALRRFFAGSRPAAGPDHSVRRGQAQF